MDCSPIITSDAVASSVGSAESPAISAKPSLDKQIVNAFRGMEAPVCDAFYAASLLADVMDRHFGQSAPVDGRHAFELTDLEWNTLFFAVNQAVLFADQTRRQYYNAYEDVPTQGNA